MLMLRTIRRGLSLPGAQDHPWFHECLVRFLRQLETWKSSSPSVSPLVHEVLLSEAQETLSAASLAASTAEKINDEFIKRHTKSFIHVFRG